MRISVEQFKELVKTASKQTSARRDERRAAARIGVRYLVTVRPIIPLINTPATPFQVWLRDVSGAGFGITSPVAMLGRFTLELPNLHDVIHAIDCNVLSSRPVGEDSFHVGAGFANVAAMLA